MKRMLDLYSKYREDKDTIRRDRLEVSHGLQTALRRLKLERDEKIFRLDQERAAELRRIHRRLCREAQVLRLQERGGRCSEKELLAMRAALDARAEECEDLRKAAGTLCHEKCQEVKEEYYKEVDALERHVLEQSIEIDARESAAVASFRAAEQALLETYRKEREEKGGEA